MKAWLKKAAGYVLAFFAGIVAVAGIVLMAILKRDPEPKKEHDDAETAQAEDIRADNPGHVLDSLPDTSQERIAEIKRSAIDSALKRARDRRANNYDGHGA